MSWNGTRGSLPFRWNLTAACGKTNEENRQAVDIFRSVPSSWSSKRRGISCYLEPKQGKLDSVR